MTELQNRLRWKATRARAIVRASEIRDLVRADALRDKPRRHALSLTSARPVPTVSPREFRAKFPSGEATMSELTRAFGPQKAGELFWHWFDTQP